jgi:hypothetical protein
MDEDAEAKAFWERFVKSYQSGDQEKLLDCFSKPHSKLIKTYSKSESAQVSFLKTILKEFGKEGLATFNNHNIVGGTVFTWPSTFSNTSPKVIQKTKDYFILDDYGWRLEVKKWDDGIYRITNADEAFASLEIEKMKRQINAYELGTKILQSKELSSSDIPSLRNRVFEIELGLPVEEFRRFKKD